MIQTHFNFEQINAIAFEKLEPIIPPETLPSINSNSAEVCVEKKEGGDDYSENPQSRDSESNGHGNENYSGSQEVITILKFNQQEDGARTHTLLN